MIKRCARAGARPRGAVVLPAQPGRDHRRGSGEAPPALPGLRFLVAHGQMAERELEERCTPSSRGDADVLVSTTIIESGLDIPQANTLVVERADQLGLAPAVPDPWPGRAADVTAHAYLLLPGRPRAVAEARARLSTLADHTELGAGFQIAMRDLEIRGAGDLLGARAVGSRRGTRVRALRRDAERGGRGAVGTGARRRSPGPRRRPRRRFRPRRLHRVGGAQDRSSPPARARRGRRRPPRAPSRAPRIGTDRSPSRSRRCSRSRRRS